MQTISNAPVGILSTQSLSKYWDSLTRSQRMAHCDCVGFQEHYASQPFSKLPLDVKDSVEMDAVNNTPLTDDEFSAIGNGTGRIVFPL